MYFFIRTNKACPLYQNSTGQNPPINVAMTEEQEEDIEKQLNTDDEDLVNVDGTKVKLSGKLLKVKTGILLCLHTLTGIGLYLEKNSRHGTSFLMRSLDFTSLSYL